MNYDFSLFHPECGEIAIQPSMDGKLYLYCPQCRVLADIEAVSMKVPAADVCMVAKKDRRSLGDQSPNVDRGCFKP